MEPIGSSTSGSQISSCVAISGRIGRFAPGAYRDLSGYPEHEQREQPTKRVLGKQLGKLHARLDPRDRSNAEEQRGPPPDVAVAALSPGPGDGGREDCEQRGRFGVELGEAEDEREGRYEQGSATDAEEPGEHARDQAERARAEERPHQIRGQTPRAASNAANANESVRSARRCWSDAPTTAPTAPGRPTTAAAPGFTSPCNA